MRKYRKENSESVRATERKRYPKRLADRKSSPEKMMKHREYHRNRNSYRKATNPAFRMADLLRKRLNTIIKKKIRGKSTEALLGVSFEFFVAHLQVNWLPGMSWENFGKHSGQWSIDHIVPLSKIDLTIPRLREFACHFTNLRPLWWDDNLKKRDSIDYDEETRLKWAEYESLRNSLLPSPSPGATTIRRPPLRGGAD